jgi:hypothetical protein
MIKANRVNHEKIVYLFDWTLDSDQHLKVLLTIFVFKHEKQ